MTAAPTRRLTRPAPRADRFMVPRAVAGERGRFLVDATWGTIKPIEIAHGVRTIGELEVIEHLRRGLPLVDSRRPEFFSAGTIPGALSIPHTEVSERLAKFDPQLDTALFCNGPQCAATPDAIRILLDAGHPAGRLLYYRGGIHDWVTLGLPLETGRPAAAEKPQRTGDDDRMSRTTSAATVLL